MRHAILLISCPDQRGVTAAVTNFVFENNGNILHAEQHTDEQIDKFFMRIEWSMEGFQVDKEKIGENFQSIAARFGMKREIYFTDEVPRAAIFVSRHLHCLYDLLLRQKAGQFHCEMPLIISNHPDAKPVAKSFGMKFFEMSVTHENKIEQEKREIAILKKEKIDLIILARYHQILTGEFVDKFEHRIINIHHSFLPAFAGKDPYTQAYRKGVKLIGATSHYVTEQLDKGPIIEQNTVRISHKETIEDLIRTGEDLEKVVLSRAVRWHLQRKILCYGNKTVVFD